MSTDGDLEDDERGRQVTSADPTFESILDWAPTLSRRLARYDRQSLAATFSGLLTAPEFQCNCMRLEVLVHLGLQFGVGSSEPTPRGVTRWFAEMSAGPCGYLEDPAEDAFASNIATDEGNFLVLEGTWESGAFYLQRLLDALDSIDAPDLLPLKRAVRGLLRISDLVCRRAGLVRNQAGATNPLSHLESVTDASLRDYRRRVTISQGALRAIGVSTADLAPFIAAPPALRTLCAGTLQQSALQRQPLARMGRNILVALPTAISAAIRTQIVDCFAAFGRLDTLVYALAQEYSRFFQRALPLPHARPSPLTFQPTSAGVMASYGYRVDARSWVQFIFVLDHLAAWDERGLVGAYLDPDRVTADLTRLVTMCRSRIPRVDDDVAGISVVIMCGIGRGWYFPQPECPDGWRVTTLSAADASTLGDLWETGPLDLLRLLEMQEVLANEHDVHFVNLGGVANLIAYTRAQGGHLIEHSHLPQEAGRGSLRVLVAPSWIRDIRLEGRVRADHHAQQSPSDAWVLVRRCDRSHFPEDDEVPVHAVCNGQGPPVPIVISSASRRWWCEVQGTHDFARWETLRCWFPRIVAALEANARNLPDGTLSLVVTFTSYRSEPEVAPVPSLRELRRSFRVSARMSSQSVSVEVGAAFEHALAAPTNIAEAELVQAMVRGFLRLIPSRKPSLAMLVSSIVPNETARWMHAFPARRYRDFVAASASPPPEISKHDNARLRLGVAWRARQPSQDRAIRGKRDCTAFLNAVVRALEDDLCRNLRSLDRRETVLACLHAHEAAMIRRAQWRRTANSRLSLSRNPASAMQVLVDHEFDVGRILLGSRIIVEAAVHECPLNGGRTPGAIDLSRMMALVNLLVGYGGWSDAIHLDALAPSLEISPLGDIQAETRFFETIIEPFGYAAMEDLVEEEVDEFREHFDEPSPVPNIGSTLEPAFLEAWIDEYGFSIDQLRQAVDVVEDMGLALQLPVFETSLEEIRNRLGSLPRAALDVLLTVPRATWHEVPAGISARERFPWGFRRLLSLLRRPIVQIDDAGSLLVAPGLVRDAMGQLIGNHREGRLRHSQVRTQRMKAWFGTAADRRGDRFADLVCCLFRELGWRAERDVSVSSILKRRTSIDFGDIDVLAWDDASRRVLLVECKSLHFRSTPGEIAEQLRDFRGEATSEGRDDLLKHLDRCDELSRDRASVGAFVQLDGPFIIEGWIAFSREVPMLFVRNGPITRLRTTIYDRVAAAIAEPPTAYVPS